jgi:hypothetical protein
MSDAQRSHANMSVRAGEGASVTCHTYPDTTPILSVDLPGGTWLSISLADREARVCEQAVRFARALVGAAEQFAAEAERLYGPDDAQDAAA